MRISFEYHGNRGSIEIDDYAIVALVDEIFFKPCSYCAGAGKILDKAHIAYGCGNCSETGKIRRFY